MRFIKKPSPPQGNGQQEVWMRRFMDWVSQFELTGVVGGLKKPNPNGDGYSLVMDTDSGSSAGWRWAEPKTYAKETSYSVGKVVVILPDADIVVTGAASADDAGATIMASAGVWVAMRSVPVESGPQYHIPKLPMPDETDMDATTNYWLRISPLC